MDESFWLVWLAWLQLGLLRWIRNEFQKPSTSGHQRASRPQRQGQNNPKQGCRGGKERFMGSRPMNKPNLGRLFILPVYMDAIVVPSIVLSEICNRENVSSDWMGMMGLTDRSWFIAPSMLMASQELTRIKDFP